MNAHAKIVQIKYFDDEVYHDVTEQEHCLAVAHCIHPKSSCTFILKGLRQVSPGQVHKDPKDLEIHFAINPTLISVTNKQAFLEQLAFQEQQTRASEASRRARAQSQNLDPEEE